ncbi:MAG: carbohydrate-binding domain-containing protein, partial [Propionibacteriaceae bacterium]|nr:carbohydrate-binding domain-containing protein [Propionibacteriaceae bacterium]
MSGHQPRRLGLPLTWLAAAIALIGALPASLPAPAKGLDPYTAIIDLGVTNTPGDGYVVFDQTGNIPALRFMPGATGKTYKIIQTAPERFFGIDVLTGGPVTLVISGIDTTHPIWVNPGSDLTLILDGTNYVRSYISVPETTAITIDSLNDSETDKLIIPSTPGSSNTNAAIGGQGAHTGGLTAQPGGVITINGGYITITASSTGAGIGGGGCVPMELGNQAKGSGGGVITINGGRIDIAQYGYGNPDGGGFAGAAIGSGGHCTSSSSLSPYGPASQITINGGTINVTQYSNAAGIGAGTYARVGTIVINGGTIDAKSIRLSADPYAGAGAAIGSSAGTSATGPASITINGGQISATTESVGAGIGASNNNQPVEITITGGQIYAMSRAGSGIGYVSDPKGSRITITGGQIVAESQTGAGIGNYPATAPDFCLGPGAEVKAYSKTGPAFNVRAVAPPEGHCSGYHVNAQLNQPLSPTKATRLDV